MSIPTLTISSKNYSSWSLRGWLMMRMADVEFEEIVDYEKITLTIDLKDISTLYYALNKLNLIKLSELVHNVSICI
mgnify:CR=1 FL=1